MALVATDLEVQVLDRWVEGRKRHAVGKLLLPNGGTYPDGGIPLPEIGKFGVRRQMDSFDIFGLDTERVVVSAPEVTPVAEAGNIDAGDHYYKVTVVTPEGETLASKYTGPFTANNTESKEIQKTIVARPDTYPARATGWNVYRTKADADPDSAAFYLVNGTPVDIAVDHYDDNVADASLEATEEPTADYTLVEYMTRYDKTNHKLFLYVEEAEAAGGPLLEAGTSEVPGPRAWDFHVTGW